jgi:hypothetical protein
MSALARYEEMRIAVERCARIDEAAEIRDKAAALQAYARQRDDKDLGVWTSEIHKRAVIRIGELSQDLPQADHGGAGGGAKFSEGGISKAAALANAGISNAAAYRYEELAGPPELRSAVREATERLFASARAERRLNEMMDHEPKAKAGNPNWVPRGPDSPATLAEAGIDKHLAHRARRAGAMSAKHCREGRMRGGRCDYRLMIPRSVGLAAIGPDRSLRVRSATPSASRSARREDAC